MPQFSHLNSEVITAPASGQGGGLAERGARDAGRNAACMRCGLGHVSSSCVALPISEPGTVQSSTGQAFQVPRRLEGSFSPVPVAWQLPKKEKTQTQPPGGWGKWRTLCMCTHTLAQSHTCVHTHTHTYIQNASHLNEDSVTSVCKCEGCTARAPSTL